MSDKLESIPLPEPQLDLIENFPAWEKATDLLKQQILSNNFKKVADVGGGANPLLDYEFIRGNNIDYALLDISEVELSKAPAYYRKIKVDMTTPPKAFSKCVGVEQFDLIFSHMFLEHAKDPLAMHRNIHSILRPGGVAIHIYPTPNNLPLTINRLLPEQITSALVSFAQPLRDRDGSQVKFPAFYAMCGHPTEGLHSKFRDLGFNVVRHTSYIGHDYYRRFPVIRNIERSLRPILLKAKIPLAGNSLLVLQKQLV